MRSTCIFFFFTSLVVYEKLIYFYLIAIRISQSLLDMRLNLYGDLVALFFFITIRAYLISF